MAIPRSDQEVVNSMHCSTRPRLGCEVHPPLRPDRSIRSHRSKMLADFLRTLAESGVRTATRRVSENPRFYLGFLGVELRGFEPLTP
jgi:hypothetical protein